MDIAYIVVKDIRRGGGIEKYTLELGRRLAERGHKITVYSMGHYGQKVDSFDGMDIVTVPAIKGRTLEKGTAAFFALCKAIRRKHDLVHFHTIPAGTWVFLARLMGCRCVLQWHGLEWKRSRFNSLSSKIALMLERFVIRRKVAFTAVSQTQCDYFAKTYGIETKYIPTGAEIKQVPEAQEIISLGLESQKYILFASRLVREKGAHYLIPAFRRLDTDCKLVIAGDVPNETEYKNELMELADNDPRIVFPGFVEGRLLDELFGHCLLYVQPSDIEGLSIALMEAMSYGCGVLVSDIPENIEAVGDVGWRFEHGDIDSLYEKFADILNTPEKIVLDREKAIARIVGEYNWDHIADEFEKYYQGLIDKQ